MNKQKKIILITGGSGFLGRNLALFFKDKYEVILASRNNKQNLEAGRITGCKSVPLNVESIESVRDVINEFKPNIIIHAAATKFVDLAEKQPMECVDINVVGSQNVARVALDKKVEIVLGISTDKASPPIRNIYGMSKAIMERIFCSMNEKSTTKFACVRYGNVAWSTGSVLPLWDGMWKKTKIIGTTGPEMRRFFFTVNEAVALVNTAIENIDDIQGKVLSREMKSAMVEDILKVWVKNKGGKYEKIEGRPGERNDEFLVGEIELPYTYETVYNNVKHFVIAFNQKAKKPLEQVFSSVNAKRLTGDEILTLISNKPIV